MGGEVEERKRGREKRKKIGGEDRSGVTAVRGWSTLHVHRVFITGYWYTLKYSISLYGLSYLSKYYI